MSGVAMNLDVLLTGAQCARFLAVSRQLVAHWVSRGKLKPVKVLPNGRKLYRLGDVLQVEAEMAAKSGRA